MLPLTGTGGSCVARIMLLLFEHHWMVFMRFNSWKTFTNTASWWVQCLNLHGFMDYDAWLKLEPVGSMWHLYTDVTQESRDVALAPFIQMIWTESRCTANSCIQFTFLFRMRRAAWAEITFLVVKLAFWCVYDFHQTNVSWKWRHQRMRFVEDLWNLMTWSKEICEIYQ